eukprot:168592-Pleurochrysis_carterae.AAC.1
MTAERDARHAARARGVGARTLEFDTPAQAGVGGMTPLAGGKCRADQAGLDEGGGGNRRRSRPRLRV